MSSSGGASCCCTRRTRQVSPSPARASSKSCRSLTKPSRSGNPHCPRFHDLGLRRKERTVVKRPTTSALAAAAGVTTPARSSDNHYWGGSDPANATGAPDAPDPLRAKTWSSLWLRAGVRAGGVLSAQLEVCTRSPRFFPTSVRLAGGKILQTQRFIADVLNCGSHELWRKSGPRDRSEHQRAGAQYVGVSEKPAIAGLFGEARPVQREAQPSGLADQAGFELLIRR